ncbi:MAG: right-handed parallel beta-helix repeat-containing protein [Planctomycetota bacterium]|jgi:hypothetical protein
MNKLSMLCVATLVLLQAEPLWPAALEVRPPGGVGALGDIYTSIQDAIDDANDGDTLVIHDGTYDETINIEGFNGLTLSGEDKTTVIVKSSTTLDWNVGTYGSTRQAVFRIVNSTGVVIENMTMDFDLVRANFVFGVMGWDSTVTVDNCILKNMSVDDLSGGYYDIGSYFRAPGYTDVSRADVTVTNSTFIDMGRQGVATHDYVNANISGNTFYKTTNDFGYAIEVGSQSAGSVTGNTIYGYDTPAASDGSESAGIYVEPAFTGRLHGGPISVVKPVTVQGNEVYDCQYAMWVGNGYDGYAGDVDIVINVTGNNFHNNVDGAVILQDEDAEDGSSINAAFQGNTVSDNNSVGYHIFTHGDGDITAAFSGETITGHDTGLLVADYASGASSSSYSVEIHDSNLSGNGSYGVDNAVSSIVVDAIENCWGDPTGPYHPITNPGGFGSQVSDNVSYYPWYLDCTFTTPVYKPVHNVTLDAYYDTIREAVDAARNGDIIEVAEGTFTEDVAIDVSVILHGAQTGQDPRGGRSGDESEIVGSIRVLPGVADITIDGFKITGTELGAMKGVCMRIESQDSLIKNNIIVAVDGSGYDYSGIVDLEGITNTTIERNDFSGAYDAARQPNVIRLGVTGPGVVLISQNEMHNVGGGGGIGVMCSNNDAVINIIENEIEGTGDGIWFWDPVSGSFEVDIQSNSIFNCQKKGVKIVSPIGAVAVNCNRIYDNGEEGVYNGVSSVLVDASFNWWGDSSGPGPVGGGTGDEVSDYVDFFPWLLSTDCGDYTQVVADIVVDDDWELLPDWATVNVGGTDYYIGLNAFAVIQDAIDAASDGNSISVLEGTYDESPNVTESVTLKSLDGKDVTNIILQAGPTYLGALTINASDVLVEGFTVTGFDAVGNGLASSNIVVVSGKSNVEIADNRILVGKIGPGSNGDDGFGLLTYYSTDNVGDNLNVHDNVIEPLATEGARAFYINPGIDHFAFSNNTIAGTFTRTAITQAMNGLVQNNILTGTGSSAGLGTWGYPDPNVWGHTEFTGNTITDTQRAIALYSTEDVYINNNSLYANEVGVYVMEYSGTFDASTIRIKNNNIFDNNSAGVDNTVSGAVDATYNWWGDASGPNDPCGASETDGAVCYDVSTIKNADGLGDAVSEGNAGYCPWLVAPTCSSAYPCLAGDLNFDGCVDWRDFAIFALSWLEGCE